MKTVLDHKKKSIQKGIVEIETKAPKTLYAFKIMLVNTNLGINLMLFEFVFDHPKTVIYIQ